MTPTPTRKRILDAFRRLVVERGLDATTTRAVALEAGVNEVTIYRHFKDKAGLAHSAFSAADTLDAMQAYPFSIDASSPQTALAGLVSSLRYLRQGIQNNIIQVQFGMGEYYHFPDLREEIKGSAMGAEAFVRRAVEQASPQFRQGIDLRAAELSLFGLVFTTCLLQARDWMRLDDEEWERLLVGAVKPLLKEEE
ncbi:MAG TPA: helix-turn-helix domain-containing protein [Anaerolineaceae bacterium]|jgi:AcrR family transcriptional regulator